MKGIILIFLIVFLSKEVFSQYIIIHKNVGTNLHSKIGEIDSITFFPETVSYSGKTYNVVIIGSQIWLKENIDVGTRIDGSQNQIENETIEKYCYNDEPNNCDTYGGLYQWNEAMQYTTTAGTQGICPGGWHIPTLSEFQTLSTTVSNDGNALKDIGQGSGGGAGTNTSGFSALLAGNSNSGSFSSLNVLTYFWSSSTASSNSYSMRLQFDSGFIQFYFYDRGLGYSVRCLKD